MNPNMSHDEWLAEAREWLIMRRGLWDARSGEALVGYTGAFDPVYAIPCLDPDEPMYVWFISPGQGCGGRIVNWITRDTFVDHEGNVIEHPEEWTLCLGTARKGCTPLLTREMLEEEANDGT